MGLQVLMHLFLHVIFVIWVREPCFPYVALLGAYAFAYRSVTPDDHNLNPCYQLQTWMLQAAQTARVQFRCC